MPKRKYSEWLEEGWEERRMINEDYELPPPSDLEYDPVDEVDACLQDIPFNKVRFEYLQFIAMQAKICIFNENDVINFNESLNKRTIHPINGQETSSILELLFDEEKDKIAKWKLKFLNCKTPEATPEATRAVNLVETCVKPLSLGENFCELLKANKYNAFRLSELKELRNALRHKQCNIIPKVFSPFHSILTQLNKLRIFRAFYNMNFGDEDEVQSNEETLRTVIRTHDYIHLLSQMYYLQPQKVVKKKNGYRVDW